MKKGGAAKGELVLAMYELANSFRHGWGVEKDLVAARSYYETAANLGDTDAMNEVARCYEEGSGGKKDKVRRLLLFLDLASTGGPSEVRSLSCVMLVPWLDTTSIQLEIGHLSPSSVPFFSINVGQQYSLAPIPG